MRIFIFIIVLLSSISLNANAYNISDSIEIISLDEETYFYKTKNELLEITDLIDVDWTKSNQGGNFGLVRSIYWLKYELRSPWRKKKVEELKIYCFIHEDYTVHFSYILVEKHSVVLVTK